MKLSYLASAAAAASLFAAPVAAERAPSEHIRCDGNPDNVTAGETAARLVGAITLLGLFAPAHETPDSSMRLEGEPGIAICNAALDGESNDVRRAQLILAGAIHQIEAGHYDAAIEQAHRVATDRPELAATKPFQLSLELGAMEVEAMALYAQGHVDEARAKAFEMAAAAPYDLVTQARALRFVQLSPTYGSAEQAYYANLVRLFPVAVLTRAAERQVAGDYRGGAEDYELWLRFSETIVDDAPMASLAYAALANALAGNVERAAELQAQARTALDAEPNATGAATTSELLDLYQIWKTAHDGRVADARLLFANRASWRIPSAGAVAEVARLLQQGADAAQPTGPLAGDARAPVTELIERRRRAMTETKDRFGAVRGYFAQSSFDRFGANVWRERGSRYFRDEDARMHARPITVIRDGAAPPAGYAMLLHAALVAQSEGKHAFMLMPVQPTLAGGAVRFGNPGDEGMIDAMSFDTAQVISDLQGIIPRPVRR